VTVTGNANSCPLSRAKVIDRYFLEHRAKVLDVAAFLDRVERAAPEAGAKGREDFRVAALRRAIAILGDGRPERAKRILELLSDPTEPPIASAKGMKGAHGAYPGAAR
jgi:hypothetical protein